jgi:hypothetical protein
MKPLLDTVANPSGFDSLSNYVGQTDFGQFYTLITRSRDSDTLTESNWICALELLGGESETVEIHRFGMKPYLTKLGACTLGLLLGLAYMAAVIILT